MESISNLIRGALAALILLIGATAMPEPSLAQSTTTCRNATTYGADPTAALPSNAAFSAAISASDGVHLCVYFPAGRYRFTSSIFTSLSSQAPNASLTIVGDASDTTELVFPANSDGIVTNLNATEQSFHFRNLSVLANGIASSTSGILVNNFSNGVNSAQNHIENVTVRGSDGYNRISRWQNGIVLYQVSNTNLTSVSVFGSSGGQAYATAGTCLIDYGSSSSIAPVAINISSSQFNYCQYGIVMGNYLQGLQVVTSNFVGNAYGIFVAGGQIGNDQLAVSSSQFNNSSHDIYVGSIIDGVTLTGNDFYGGAVSGTICVNLAQAFQYSITGNTFINFGSSAPSQNALVVGQYGGASGIVTGNNFYGPFVTAIWLQSSSQRVNVQSNSYLGPTNIVLNQGSNNVVGGGSF